MNTIEDLKGFVRIAFPIEGELGVDNQGQLVIYTGLKEDEVGLVPLFSDLSNGKSPVDIFFSSQESH